MLLLACAVVLLLWNIIPRKAASVSTIDDTDTDIDALSRLIDQLPPAIQDAIANGTISLAVDWIEVTRDEDDYPTIKPRLVLKNAT